MLPDQGLRAMNQRVCDYWAEACDHLARVDSVLAELIASFNAPVLSSRDDAFYSLCRAVVGQLISVKAAQSVWERCLAAVGAPWSPRRLAAVPDEALRTAGLSRTKVTYLRELSSFFLAGPEADWHAEHDEAVIEALMRIRGIGRWSAQMFLIFHLMRPDVLPLGDMGLRNSIALRYGDGVRLTTPQIEHIAEPWRPYRTVAVCYLWRSKDPDFIGY